MVGWWAPFKEQDREMEEEQYLQSLSHRKPLEGRQGFILLSWRERSGAESTRCEHATQHDQGYDLRMRTQCPAGYTSVPLSAFPF